MLRDPEQFRLRFNRWKNGELVYLNGRPTELPKYEDGVVPPVTTGGSGLPVPYVRQPKLQLNSEGQKIKLFLERASNFAPYVGTIQDWKEVTDGNLNKLPSAVIGTIADIALPGLRTSIKAAKATRKLMITTPRIVDKAKYYRAAQKATRKAIMNGAYQGVGTYQDILDDLGLYPKYKDGIVGSIKNAILGASIAEDPAVATAAGWLLTNNGVVQRSNLSTRLLGKALTELSFFSPTNPASAATTGLLNLGGKAVRMFRPASTKSLILPIKVDVEPLSNIDNLTEADFKNWIQGKEVETLKDLVPEYLHPATKDVPVDVIESILNSITPRLIKMRPFLNPQEVENSVLNAVTRKYNEYPVEAYLRAGEGSTLGIHVPSTDFISIRQGSANKSLQHELRHSLYDLYNPALAEEKLMDRAYNHLFPKKIETWTTNGDARKLLIGPEANRKMPVPQLNRLIDAASKKQVVKAVHDANAYGASYIDNLIKEYGEVPDRIVNAIKRAMKYVAVGNAVTPVVKNKSKK